MAYVAQQDDPNAPVQPLDAPVLKAAAAPSSEGTPSASGVVQDSTPKSASSGTFNQIGAYLNANQAGGQNLAGQMASDITGKTSAANQSITGADTSFRDQVSQGLGASASSAAPAETAQAAPSSIATESNAPTPAMLAQIAAPSIPNASEWATAFAAPSVQQGAGPFSIGSDLNKLISPAITPAAAPPSIATESNAPSTDFLSSLKQLGIAAPTMTAVPTAYSGPNAFSGSQGAQNTLNDVQAAQQEALLGTTVGGRTQLLNQVSAAPMTTGGTNLDQYLIQGSPTNLNTVLNAAAGAAPLGQRLSDIAAANDAYAQQISGGRASDITAANTANAQSQAQAQGALTQAQAVQAQQAQAARDKVASDAAAAQQAQTAALQQQIADLIAKQQAAATPAVTTPTAPSTPTTRTGGFATDMPVIPWGQIAAGGGGDTSVGGGDGPGSGPTGYSGPDLGGFAGTGVSGATAAQGALAALSGNPIGLALAISNAIAQNSQAQSNAATAAATGLSEGGGLGLGTGGGLGLGVGEGAGPGAGLGSGIGVGGEGGLGLGGLGGSSGLGAGLGSGIGSGLGLGAGGGQGLGMGGGLGLGVGNGLGLGASADGGAADGGGGGGGNGLGLGASADGGAADGGGGGGGGKIICTAMNDAYGLPYRENKIWTHYASTHLKPQHQKGYHKVFLPLVDYAYKQGTGWSHRFVRHCLEYIAVNRTIDIKAELAGTYRRPVHKALRNICEPILYFIGSRSK